jgi:hypothetical protein
MVQLIEHFQKVAHVSGNSVERGYQNDIEAMPAGICKELVQSGPFEFCPRTGVCVFVNDFIPALLSQFAQVVKLYFCVLVAGGYARLNDRAFAGTSFSPNFDFGS